MEIKEDFDTKYAGLLRKILANYDNVANGAELIALLWLIHQSTGARRNQVVATVAYMNESMMMSNTLRSKVTKSLIEKKFISKKTTAQGVGIFTPCLENIANSLGGEMPPDLHPTTLCHLTVFNSTFSNVPMFPTHNTIVCWLWIAQRAAIKAGSGYRNLVTKKELEEGVYINDWRIQCPLGLSYNTWVDALYWLESKGFINRTYGRRSALTIEIRIKPFLRYIEKKVTPIPKQEGNVLAFDMSTRRHSYG